MAEEYFKDLSGGSQQQAQAVKAAQAGVQPSLELLRTQLHQLLHEVATNRGSRGPLLNWLASIIARNGKRTQLQANERLVAGDGFMLNVASVLQHLCAKVKQDKVDPEYLHRPNCRIDISEESRLKASSQEAKEYVEKQEDKESNFPTECWFLTLVAHHVGVLPIVRRYQRRLRALRELAKMVEVWFHSKLQQHKRISEYILFCHFTTALEVTSVRTWRRASLLGETTHQLHTTKACSRSGRSRSSSRASQKLAQTLVSQFPSRPKTLMHIWSL